jgi:hypothetical protein
VAPTENRTDDKERRLDELKAHWHNG